MAAELPVSYYVFDLLWAGGYDLRPGRLRDRKMLLAQLLLPDAAVSLLDHFEADGEAAYRAAVEHGLEGVLAKRRDSTYESGRRSKSWLKVKATLEDDFALLRRTMSMRRAQSDPHIGEHDVCAHPIPIATLASTEPLTFSIAVRGG